jgi:hypothetical protein
MFIFPYVYCIFPGLGNACYIYIYFGHVKQNIGLSYDTAAIVIGSTAFFRHTKNSKLLFVADEHHNYRLTNLKLAIINVDFILKQSKVAFHYRPYFAHGFKSCHQSQDNYPNASHRCNLLMKAYILS